jgi:hypothetical protein
VPSGAQAELALGAFFELPDRNAGHAINDSIDCNDCIDSFSLLALASLTQPFKHRGHLRLGMRITSTAR